MSTNLADSGYNTQVQSRKAGKRRVRRGSLQRVRGWCERTAGTAEHGLGAGLVKLLAYPGLSEDFPDVLSSSQLFSIVPRHYTPNTKLLSILSGKFSNVQIGVFRIVHLGCHPERAWCSAQRIKITMIAGGNHTIIQSESKDLCTDLTANVIIMRRFFDFVLRTPLRMT